MLSPENEDQIVAGLAGHLVKAAGGEDCGAALPLEGLAIVWSADEQSSGVWRPDHSAHPLMKRNTNASATAAQEKKPVRKPAAKAIVTFRDDEAYCYTLSLLLQRVISNGDGK